MPDKATASMPLSYVQGMERLLDVVQDLSLARDLDSVLKIVRTAARALTGCDGATLVLNEDDTHCYYADEDAIAPLWKGQRFTQESCISGWVMRRAKPVIITDVLADPRIPADLYSPTFVKSMVMVPIRTRQPVGAIGNYWARHNIPRATDIRLLQALANATSVAMENVLFHQRLEDTVRQRTHQVTEAHRLLEKSASTDELTGLLNRRGFYEQARASLQSDRPALLAYIDADGLKAVNDKQGHAAGDAMLVDIAEALRHHFRPGDIIARLGGDEFCVLVMEPEHDGTTVRAQLAKRIAQLNIKDSERPPLSVSIGFVETVNASTIDLDKWMDEADRRMYNEKRARKKERG